MHGEEHRQKERGQIEAEKGEGRGEQAVARGSRVGIPSNMELEGRPEVLPNSLSGNGGSERSSNLSQVTQLNADLRKER